MKVRAFFVPFGANTFSPVTVRSLQDEEPIGLEEKQWVRLSELVRTGQAKKTQALQDPLKWTPIFRALEDDHLPLLKLLVDSGADINHRGWNGETPLRRAY